jgi:hypothetical protein
MRIRHRLRSLTLLGAAALALFSARAHPVLAQDNVPRVRLGAGLGADLLVGDASDFLDSGISRFLMADFRLDSRDVFHIRLDASLAPLVDDEDELTGARAENDLLAFLAGPQFTGTLGRVRPYAGALAGLTAVIWTTDVPTAVDETDEGASSSFAWGGHVGLGFTLDRGDHPVVLQLEGRLVDSGSLRFARAPGIDPRDPVGFIRDDIAVISLRLAITLGF